MAKNHGARQQKKLAKQKAKRQEKRTSLLKRDSVDPTIRLQRVESWPVVQALMAEELWSMGIGYLLIARREGEGRYVYASYMLDVFCLGVKDTFWRACSKGEFDEMVERVESTQTLIPIKPECFVKIIQGAVEFANAVGFGPHHDFKHSSKLLQGIDPDGCTEEFTFGKDGHPFYIQGPHESPQEAAFIMQRIHAAGGHFVAGLSTTGLSLVDDNFLDDEDDEEFEDDGMTIDITPESEDLPPPTPTES